MKVLGIGGVFFRARDPLALGEWYKRYLGLHIHSWGGTMFEAGDGKVVWSMLPDSSEHTNTGRASFMINYRVSDLESFLAKMRAEGCEVEERMDTSEYGKFGWVIDPEGNRIELWQPK